MCIPEFMFLYLTKSNNLIHSSISKGVYYTCAHVHIQTYIKLSILLYIVGPEKLKPRTLEIFEQNHVFFADTAVGHRNWAHWYLPNFQVAVLHCITYIANGMIYYCVKSTLSYSSLVCMV